MRIIIDGRRVMRTKTHKTYLAHYYRNKAFFTKRGMTKRLVLHELYHHLVYVNGLDMTKTKEERAANSYARFPKLKFCEQLAVVSMSFTSENDRL